MTHRPTHGPANRRAAGFTLIEMMVATAVSGVLASVAYPSFTGSVQKARRSEALIALMEVQQVQERFRSNGSRYGALAEIGVAAAVAGGRYVVDVAAPSATGYVATAAARGSQASDHGCRHLQLAVDGASWTMRSGATPAADNDDAANRRCWNQ